MTCVLYCSELPTYHFEVTFSGNYLCQLRMGMMPLLGIAQLVGALPHIIYPKVSGLVPSRAHT